MFVIAVKDILKTFARYELVGMLAWQDVRQRYRRSAIGPFWITINMGVMISIIALVFGHFFGAAMKDFLPFLSVGMVVWGFISTSLSDSCMSFILAEGIIKQLPIPIFVHVARVVWRNVVMFAHNMLIIPVVFVSMGVPFSPVAIFALLGLLLLLLNLSWVALMVSIFCARYRDFPQVISNTLQIIFYLTPVMWMPQSLPQRASLYLLSMNPFYHSLEIIRAPLLGQVPAVSSWFMVLLMAVFGWTVTLFIYDRYKNRIAYWL